MSKKRYVALVVGALLVVVSAGPFRNAWSESHRECPRDVHCFYLAPRHSTWTYVLAGLVFALTGLALILFALRGRYARPMTDEPEPTEPEAEPQSDDDEDETEKPFTRDDFMRDLRKVAKPEE